MVGDPEKISLIVQRFKTQNEFGFTRSEMEELLTRFPALNMSLYNSALMGITCLCDENNEPIYFKHDVQQAIICGMSHQCLGLNEWD